MADNISDNAVLAELQFGIGNIEKQMLEIQALANKTALTVQETFAKTKLTLGPDMSGVTTANDAQLVKNLTATQAKRLNILREGEARAQAVVAESQTAQEAFVAQSYTNMGVQKMMADAQIKNSAELTAQSIIESQNRVDLEIGESTQRRVLAEQVADAKIDAITAKSATQRSVMEQKADAQILMQREKTAAQIALIEQRTQAAQARTLAYSEKTGSMANLLQRRTSWLVSGGLVFGGLAGLGEAVSTINEVESGMTVIARVTEDVNFNFKEMRDELQQLGVTYGDVWADTSDIAIKWAQAGYNMADTAELTKDSLLALNTAELNSEQATSGLIAIMAQWGLTAEDLLPVIDKINKVADDYAITSSDLVAGLTRSSGAAKVLGMTMEETIAILTAMREATGRTGKEVGNALNSILSFMQRPTAIKAFETEGIRVFADEARTQFRNVIEVFEEMAKRWPQMSEATQNAFVEQADAAGLYSEEMAEVIGQEEEYNDIQQRNLSQAAAGIYRRNYLLALLQNWSKVDEVLISQENSLGYSLAENERTMQTLAKQIEVLKASAEQLAVALGDTGILNELKGLVEGTTEAIQRFNELDDDTQTLIVTFVEVTLAVKLLDAALKSLGLSATLTGGAKLVGLAAIGPKLAEVTKGITSVAAAATAAKVAANGLAKGLLAAAGGPVGVALIAIGTAASFIAREVKKANEELEEHAVMASGLIKEYDSLTAKMEGMAQGTEEYNKAAQELVALKGNIANSLPEVVDGFNDETGAIEINRSAMEQLIDAGEKLKESKETESDAYAKEIERLQEDIKAHEDAARQYESSQNVLEDLAKRREDLTAVLAKQTKESEEAQKTQEALGETERLIADIATKAGLKRTATIDEIMAKLKQLSMAEKQAAIETQLAEAMKTQSVINESYRRLKALGEEIKANKSTLSGGKYYDDIPIWLKGKYNFLPGGEGWTRKELLENQEEEAAENEKLRQNQAALTDQLNEINEAQERINALKADAITSSVKVPATSTGGGNEYTSSEKMAAIIGKWTDNLETADEATWEYSIALQELSTKQSILESEIGDSIPTLEQQQAALANLTDQSEQHRLTQEALHEVNEANRVAMAGLDGEIETAKRQYGEYASETQKLVKAKEDLEKQTRQNSKEWWVEQAAIVSLSKSMQELQEDTVAKTYQSERDTMQHKVNLAQMTTEQQIKELMRMKDTYLLTVKETWEIDEELYSLRKKLLQEYLDELEDEYNDKLERIDNRTDRTVARLQAKIDALDDKGTDNERERAEADHNQKIAELEKERYKHELREGYEHKEAIADLNQQIADEEEAWRRQQEDWALEDKKSALEDEIEAVKEAADKEEAELKKHYEKAKSIAEDSIDDIVNAIGEKDLDFEETGKSLVDAFIEGMMSGDFSEVYAKIDEITESTGSSSSSSSSKKSSSSSSSSKASSAAKKKAQATEDASEARAALIAAGYAQGAEDISSHDAKGAAEWYSQYIAGRDDLSSSIKKLFLKIANAKQAWEDADNAHTGAYVEEGGMAILRHDERVLSPNLTQSFDKLVAALTLPDVTSKISGSGTNEAAITEATNRIINAIAQQRVIAVDKMVNVENANLGDQANIQALALETRSVLMAKG